MKRIFNVLTFLFIQYNYMFLTKLCQSFSLRQRANRKLNRLLCLINLVAIGNECTLFCFSSRGRIFLISADFRLKYSSEYSEIIAYCSVAFLFSTLFNWCLDGVQVLKSARRHQILIWGTKLLAEMLLASIITLVLFFLLFG